MAKFYFNEFDGGYAPDHEGVECTDAQGVRLEAILYAAAFVRAHPEHVWVSGRMGIVVTDAFGTTVTTVTISADDAPAMNAILRRSLGAAY